MVKNSGQGLRTPLRLLDALADRLREQWGPYVHPRLQVPDPDCHCAGCIVDALSPEDQTWLQERGWEPRRSGVRVYLNLPSKPVPPCLILQVASVQTSQRGMFSDTCWRKIAVEALFVPLDDTAASVEVDRFMREAPKLVEGTFEDALAGLGCAASITNVSYSCTMSNGQFQKDRLTLTIELGSRV